MNKEIIAPEGAWRPNPPVQFSQAIKVTGGSMVYLAGQVSIDAAGNTIGVGDVREQARHVFRNIERLLEGAGGSLADIVKLVVYLPDMTKSTEVWQVRSELFHEPFPCSTGLEVKGLSSPEWLLEVDAWAVVDS